MIGSRFSPEIRRALRIDISATLLFTVFAGLTGPFLGLILRRELGATPLQLAVMSSAGGGCLLLSLLWAKACHGRPPLPYLVWPAFLARGVFLLVPFVSSAWSFVGLVIARDFFGAAVAPALGGRRPPGERLAGRRVRIRGSGRDARWKRLLGMARRPQVEPRGAPRDVPHRRDDPADLLHRLEPLGAGRERSHRLAAGRRPGARLDDGGDRRRRASAHGPVRRHRRDARGRPWHRGATRGGACHPRLWHPRGLSHRGDPHVLRSVARRSGAPGSRACSGAHPMSLKVLPAPIRSFFGVTEPRNVYSEHG